MRVIRGPARVPVSHTHGIVGPRGPDGPAQASVAVTCSEIEFGNPTSTKRITGRLFVVGASGTPGGVPTPFGSMGGRGAALMLEPPREGGRRCMDADEMRAAGMERDPRGRWAITADAERVRRAFVKAA